MLGVVGLVGAVAGMIAVFSGGYWPILGQDAEVSPLNVTPMCWPIALNVNCASSVLQVSAEALFELALQRVPATSMRNSRWGYRAIRVGESRIPAPIADTQLVAIHVDGHLL